MNIKNQVFSILAFFTCLLQGCEKFVTIDPPKTELTTQSVFTSDNSATSAMTGIYAQMMNSGQYFASGGTSSITKIAGLSADEFTNFSSNQYYFEFANNGISVTNSVLEFQIWSAGFQYIFFSNSVLEGLAGSTGVTDSVKSELTGEAKFVRAFCYLYLTNLFGNVPLYTSTEYQTNSKSARTPVSQVYNQIVADLTDAQTLLKSDYFVSNGERVRPNSSAASALLARAYLYQEKWDSAETEATTVINNSALYSLVPLNNVFLANSNEAIWQLLPVSQGVDTWEGNLFILLAPPTDVALSPFLLSAFEPGDARYTSWVSSFYDGTDSFYFPFKYKIQVSPSLSPTEYSMVIRLAEMYLVRAEARAHLNNIPGSQADIDTIRARALLPKTSAADQPSLLLAIEHERQVELFSEWGHRWLDLIRTGRAGAVLGAEKNNWNNEASLYPIPVIEIENNANISQNPGY